MQQSNAVLAHLTTRLPAVGPAVVAVLGALLFGLIAFGIGPFGSKEAFGTDIYDVYYLRILDGRMDLPVRVLRYEGHYTPDGTGYLYHGVAPLLTRFAFGWAWPLPQVSMTPFSVWVWAVLGTCAYHLSMLAMARPIWGHAPVATRFWSLVLALAVWFGTPGLLLAARPSLYHEPIAVAYAMTAGFVLVWFRATVLGRQFHWGLVLLAVCAAVTLHARPNVAVGLYAGAMIAIGLDLLRGPRRPILAALVSLAVLCGGGLLYVGLNDIRSGTLTGHGTYDESQLQYGTVFWGQEGPDSERAAAFKEHGRFNLSRVAPNLGLYAVDLPAIPALAGPSDAIRSAFREATLDRLGMIRIEGPRVGMLWLWPGWFVLALAAPFALRAPPRMLGLLLATGMAAGLMLAYGTVTFRYRFDIWPLIFVAAAIGLHAAVPRLSAGRTGMWLPAILTIAVLVGICCTALTAKTYRFNWLTEHRFFAPWTFDYCVELARERGLSGARSEDICALPEGKSAAR